MAPPVPAGGRVQAARLLATRGGHRRADLDRRSPLSRRREGCAVVVDDGSDRLAHEVASGLRRRGVTVRLVSAGELASVPLELDPSCARIEGEVVSALLFRARPDADFAAGFAEEDASFCSSEVRAAWLAVMALRSVALVNRFDAGTWFSFAEWPTWRRRLEMAGVHLGHLAVGDTATAEREAVVWVPWGGGVASVPAPPARRALETAVVPTRTLRRSLWCYGEVVAGADGRDIRAVGRVLETQGVHLAEIFTAADGGVVSCTAHPEVEEQVVRAAADRVARSLDADLRRR